jgi:hypothetical protein
MTELVTLIRRWQFLWLLLIAGLLFFAFSPAALADGPGYKTFGYNYVRPEERSDEIFIPYMAKDYNGWTSTLMIANTEAVSTELAIDISTASGQIARGFEVNVPPHGVYIYDLGDDSALTAGRYQAHIASITKVAAELHTESAYMAMSYADIGAVGTDLIIPFIEKKADNWSTTFYIHNTSDFSGRLTISYFADDHPHPVFTGTDVSIGPAQSLEFEILAESGLPDNFRGYAKVISTRTIGGTGHLSLGSQ